MTRLELITQIALMASQIAGVTIPMIRASLQPLGATDEELNAAIDVVMSDAERRKKLSDAAAGRG